LPSASTAIASIVAFPSVQSSGAAASIAASTRVSAGSSAADSSVWASAVARARAIASSSGDEGPYKKESLFREMYMTKGVGCFVLQKKTMGVGYLLDYKAEERGYL